MHADRQDFPADIRSLTALRFGAALMVVLFHFSDRAVAGSWLHATAIRHGYLGVDLFFVLSGFILAHVYLRAVETGQFRTIDFLRNRLARLYPLHVVTLVLTAVAALVASSTSHAPLTTHGPQMGLDPETGGNLARHLASQLLLVHGWGVDDRLYFNGPSWSISAEWFAYLLFPLFAGITIALARRPLVALALAAGALATAEALSQALFGNSLTERTFDLAMLRIGPEFLLGCLAYGVLRHRAVPRPLIWPGLANVLLAIGAVLAGALPLVTAPVLFAALIVLLAEAERQGLLGRAGVPAPLVYLGEISYSTYMVHLLAGKLFFHAVGRIDGIDPHALPAGVIIVGIVFVLAVSVFSYELVEQPARRRLRSAFEREARPRPAVAR